MKTFKLDGWNDYYISFNFYLSIGNRRKGNTVSKDQHTISDLEKRNF